MKYVIYITLMLSGYGLTFGLLPLVLPSFLAMDIVLVFILCVAQVKKNYTAFVLGLSIGVLIDVFISPAFGLYTLIYGVGGYVYAKFCFKTKNDNVIIAVIAVFIGYIIKDISLMGYGIVYGTVFPFWKVMWNMTLPSALSTAATAFLGYLLVLKLHELKALRSKRTLDLLQSYREEYDWLGNWFEQFK